MAMSVASEGNGGDKATRKDLWLVALISVLVNRTSDLPNLCRCMGERKFNIKQVMRERHTCIGTYIEVRHRHRHRKK